MRYKIAAFFARLHKKLTAALPSCCPLCQIPQSGSKLCSDCYNALERSVTSCSCCAEPLPDLEQSNIHALLCGRCQTTPPIFDEVITRLTYKEPVSRLIQNFKFSGDLVMLHCLADCLKQQIQQSLKRGYHLPEAIIAVPLHPKRLRSRGFNQSHLLAKTVAKNFSLKVLSHCIQRIRLTEEQTTLNRKQRYSNMKNAFEVCDAIEIEGKPIKHIAILDDVITSGSTCNELARTLKSSGVIIVDVWCIAKTPFIK